MARSPFIAYTKGVEQYIFLYDKQSIEALLDTFAKFAADSELSFTWNDAATLAKIIRDKK